METREKLNAALLPVLMYLLLVLAYVLIVVSGVFAQEQRLKEIELEKRYQAERFERAKLEQESARNTFQALSLEEAKIREGMKEKADKATKVEPKKSGN